MQFPSPLICGTLVKRYKRFLADVELADGTSITATCPNTGSMKGLCDPGIAVWLSESDSPTRKYRHTWELVELSTGKSRTLVGINTGHPNKIVMEAIEADRIPELAGFATLRREVKYGQSSRIDLLLEDPAKGLAYVEVKNTHLLRRAGLAEFPDSVTERGVKHLEELTAMVQAGHRAVMLYVIQRNDAQRWSAAADIDPRYAAALKTARNGGVEAYAYRCKITTDNIRLETAVPIEA